nr:MAG TPA: Single strand binding protein [Caudoviricetes sp.]
MLNHIDIMGRLTRDPELRRTQSGTAVASFTLAVSRDFSDKDKADFIDVVAWKSTAEFISKYFSKGRTAVVSGRLQMRDWTDKEGNKRRSAEVIAENVYFGDSKRETLLSNTDNSDVADTSYGYSDFEEINNEDDLPF